MSYSFAMRTLLIVCLCFVFGMVSAETVYKTVDKDGNVIFSDQPSEQAEVIKIKELQTIENPNPAKFKPSTNTTSQQVAVDAYQAFSIVSPAEGEGVRSNAGDLIIKLSLQPSLKRGHRVVVKLDGQEVANSKALSVALQNVDRGTHNVSAVVIDANAKTLISTSSSFSILRVALGN